MFSLIVAIEKQTGGIGYKINHCSFKRYALFQKISKHSRNTKRNVVIMGRKT